jgi:hypothetical protein
MVQAAWQVGRVKAAAQPHCILVSPIVVIYTVVTHILSEGLNFN